MNWVRQGDIHTLHAAGSALYDGQSERYPLKSSRPANERYDLALQSTTRETGQLVWSNCEGCVRVSPCISSVNKDRLTIDQR